MAGYPFGILHWWHTALDVGRVLQVKKLGLLNLVLLQLVNDNCSFWTLIPNISLCNLWAETSFKKKLLESLSRCRWAPVLETPLVVPLSLQNLSISMVWESSIKGSQLGRCIGISPLISWLNITTDKKALLFLDIESKLYRSMAYQPVSLKTKEKEKTTLWLQVS